MLRHQLLRPPKFIYPVNEWRIVEKAFYPDFLAQTETIFALANGYFGMRGNFDEGTPVAESGTFINAFYETWPIIYGEEAYGFARTGQTIVNVTDTKTIKLYVDDEPFFLPTANLLRYERVLDMRKGVLNRDIHWETPAGKQVLISSRRLVSFEHRHLAAISYRVTVLNAKAPVVISSEMLPNQPSPTSQAGQALQARDGDPRRSRRAADRVLVPKTHWTEEHRIILGLMTQKSGMSLGCGVEHIIDTRCSYTTKTECGGDEGRVVFSVNAEPGASIEIVKYITYHTSRSSPPEELAARAERTLDRAVSNGLNDLFDSQEHYLADFWHRSDIRLEGENEASREMQQALRWNLFQLLQATARAEGGGVPAKGLTGQGYEGHYFWDTEIYILPFLIYTAPRIARNLLKFRYSMLDKARRRAKELNHRGATFPWRTISGEEASAYYAAGTAQYHINADIIHAVKKYINATGDADFLFEAGAEMLVETARLWIDLGFYSKHKGGKFCIHGVTGPDEYTAVVNNNTFTNLMAQENLRFAAETSELLRQGSPELYEVLTHKTGLHETELEEWRNAAMRMHIPFDEEMGIHPQDDNFLAREVWDFANTPLEKYPLLLHFHPLDIYRHQVLKQADIVLAMFLLGDQFSQEQKKRNFDYYDPLTTGDSSLSACIQSIMACEIGYMDKAAEYARAAILMDLADVGGNVGDGCHIASMGGTWMVAIYGFAGMRDFDGRLSFRPRLPFQMTRLRFPLMVEGQRLEVEITREDATYSLQEGTELEIEHENQTLHLDVGKPVTAKVTTTVELPPGV